MIRLLKILFLLISIVGILISAKSQSSLDNFCDSLWVTGDYSTGNILAESFYNEYPALSAQYYQKWALGSVYYSDGTIVENKMLCYHGYTDNMHWQRNSDKTVGIIPKQSIEHVIINSDNNTVIFKKANLHLPLTFGNSDVLLQELVSGDVSLYCYRKVKYIKNSDEGFYPEHMYFLKMGKEYMQISLTKSGLLSKFSKEDKLKIMHLIKDQKLKIKREADMITAINLYNKRNK